MATTGKVIALIKGLAVTQGSAITATTVSGTTITADTALILGAATTSGVRLEVNSGYLEVREGDDSAGGDLVTRALGVGAAPPASTGYINCVMVQADRVIAGAAEVRVGSAGKIGFSSATSPYGSNPDVAVARDSAGQLVVTDGSTGVGNLRATALIAGTNGQGTRTAVLTASSALTSGASYTFTGALPDGAIILGVSARITTTVTGPTSVQIGDGSDADRYGIFSTLTANQTLTPADGTASPLEWRSAAGDVVLTAVGGDFTAGVIKIAVHYCTLAAPTS